MSSKTEYARIQPATGLNLTASLEYAGGNDAPVLENFLAHKPGRLVQRGPLAIVQAYNLAATNTVFGPWDFGNKLLWVSNGGSHYTATFNDDGTITVPATVTLVGKEIRDGHARVGDYVYGRPNNGYLLRWDGATTITIKTTGPYEPLDVEEFTQRLMVLGGAVPGTTTPVYSNRLYWSDPGGPPADTAAEWTDDVSGLVNQIVLPDDGVALCKVGRTLVIFCKSSVHTLNGSGPSNWTRVQALSRGCVHRDAVCPYSDGVFFLSQEGMFYFDGASERNVSGPVQDRLMQPSGKVTAGRISSMGNGYLLVTTNTDAPRLWLYHVPTGSWSTFSSTALASGTALTEVRAHNFSSRVALLDRYRIWNGGGVTGSPPDGVALSTDVLDGATGSAFPLKWTTKTVRLGTPFYKADVRRVVVDFQGPMPLTYAIYTAPNDQGGTATLLKSGSLPAPNDNVRQRTVIEVYAEAENLWVELASVGTTARYSVLTELYDVWVEYAVAQESKGY